MVGARTRAGIIGSVLLFQLWGLCLSQGGLGAIEVRASQAVPGLTVHFDRTFVGLVDPATGVLQVADVPEGRRNLTFSLESGRQWSIEVAVRAGATTSLEIAPGSFLPGTAWYMNLGPGAVQAATTAESGRIYLAGHTGARSSSGSPTVFYGSVDPKSRIHESGWRSVAGNVTVNGVGVDGTGRAVIVGRTTRTRDSPMFIATNAGLNFFPLDVNTEGRAVAVAPDGILYVTGVTGPSILHPSRAFVMALSVDATVLWTREYSSDRAVSGDDVVVDPRGGVLVMGTVSGPFLGDGKSARDRDPFVVKLRDDGTEDWTCRLDEPGDVHAVAARVSPDGTVILAANGPRPLLVRVDRGCSTLWRHELDRTESIVDVRVDDADRLYVLTTSRGQFNVHGFDERAQWTWTRSVAGQPPGAPAHDARALLLGTAGELLVVGETNANPSSAWIAGVAAVTTAMRQEAPTGTGASTASLTPKFAWIRELDPGEEGLVRSMALDAHGDVVVVGSVRAESDRSRLISTDVMVRKHDRDGEELWRDVFGTSSHDQGVAVAVDGFGNVFVAGNLEGVPGSRLGFDDIFVRKYNPDGLVQWTSRYRTPTSDRAADVAVDGDGNVVVVGTRDQFDLPGVGLHQDAFIWKLDGEGRELWFDTFGSRRHGAADDDGRGVATDSRGNVWMVGRTDGGIGGSTLGGSDAFVRRYDADGWLQWTRHLGTAADDAGSHIVIDAEDNVFLLGRTGGRLSMTPADDQGMLFLAKLTGDGDILWSRQFGADSSDTALSLAVQDGGEVVVAGATYGSYSREQYGHSDAFLMWFAPDGSAARALQFGSSGHDAATGVAIAIDGGVLAIARMGDSLSRVQAGAEEVSGAVLMKVADWPVEDGYDAAAGAEVLPQGTSVPRQAVFDLAPTYVSVSNIGVSTPNPVDGSVEIKFDVRWPESWRGPDRPSWVDAEDNWDAAWIFVKYRQSDGLWNHATLNRGGHVAPIGVAIDTPSDGTGVFVYRERPGYGVFEAEGVRLRWDASGDNVPPEEVVDLLVFALEMVYVPPGAFYAGDGNWGFDPPLHVTPGCRVVVVGGEASRRRLACEGGAAARFPTGIDGFYMMKHEATQGQYVNFLNTLSVDQVSHREIGCSIRCGIQGAVPGDFSTTLPFVAMSFGTWPQVAAFTAWAALRPMTELEFEKAARGPARPQRNAFAGYGDANAQATEIRDAGTMSEVPMRSVAGSSRPAYVYGGLVEPARVGGTAAPGLGRSEVGAGFYGVLDLSGNVAEPAISIVIGQGRRFDGTHGVGVVSPDGHADVETWPWLDGIGIGYRGGDWRGDYSDLAISGRFEADGPSLFRPAHFGMRGVRSQP